MPKIIPIRDLKDTTKISELCHSQGGPVFITKNGYDDMVIMSSEVYNSLACGSTHYQAEEGIGLYVSDNIQGCTETLPYTINEIRKVLSPIFDSYNTKSAILFGSYAKGCATSKSDIDIVVDSGLKGLNFFGLVNDICESLRVPADVFDIREIKKKSGMEKEIKTYGVRIYGE